MLEFVTSEQAVCVCWLTRVGILSTLVAYSEAAREAVLSCKPSVLAQLTSAVQHGSPALATLSMGM